MFLKSLILTGAIQGFFLILLLKTKRKNSESDKLLMIWLGIIASQLLFYYDNLSISPLATNSIQLLGFSLPLISSPVLYLYIHSLSFGSKFHWKKTWPHLLPYLLFNFITFYLYLINSANVTVSNGIPYFSNDVPPVIVFFLIALLAIIPGYYAILSLLVLLKYQKLLPDNYSYTEKINLNWLKWIVISLLILFVTLFILIKYGVGLGPLTYQNLFAVVGSILAFYIFFIGYFGLRQTTIFTNIPATASVVSETNLQTTYKNSGIDGEMAEQLFLKLKLHMEENKPFLDEDLSLTILARQLDITSNQLSQIINQKSSSNFFNFINGYRVQAIKEKLKDPAYGHYSILAIGYDCGFRSKASLNKIFKQMTGKTPSQYQKSKN
jgi:AraC-like DNA-binding protein